MKNTWLLSQHTLLDLSMFYIFWIEKTDKYRICGKVVNDRATSFVIAGYTQEQEALEALNKLLIKIEEWHK